MSATARNTAKSYAWPRNLYIPKENIHSKKRKKEKKEEVVIGKFLVKISFLSPCAVWKCWRIKLL
jgi:hypothetical protein